MAVQVLTQTRTIHCHIRGKLFQSLKERDVAPQIIEKQYVRLITQNPAVQVITAGKAKEQVYEEQGHGVFTKELLKGLEGFADADQNGLIMAIELASFVQSRVMRDTDGGHIGTERRQSQ